jgi:hypothetical protein
MMAMAVTRCADLGRCGLSSHIKCIEHAVKKSSIFSVSNLVAKLTGNMAHVDREASPDLQIERPDSDNLEKGEGKAVDNTDEDEEFNYEEQRKIIHRIDRRLVVILGYVLEM